MTARIAAVTFDCEDALTVARFWSAVLGRPLDPDGSRDFAAIGFAGRRDRAGWASVKPNLDPTWMFVRVGEPKAAKNRVHLDLVASDVDAEVARHVELGATLVGDVDEYGYTWTVLHDPEGNEYCIGRTR
jgi:Glyoxalase-like domain